MKKRKSLSKKIERLKARLERDAKKLAKLTMKLGAAVKGGKSKGKRKAVASASSGSRHSASMKQAAGPRRSQAARKVKRKLNLTPERRAQLAAAMKARWEAKRAAAAHPQGAPTNRESAASDGL